MITFQILLIIRTRAFVNVALFCTGKIPGTKNKPIKSIYTSSSTVNLLCKGTDNVFFFSKSYSVHKNINHKRPTLKLPIACFQANVYKQFLTHNSKWLLINWRFGILVSRNPSRRTCPKKNSPLNQLSQIMIPLDMSTRNEKYNR